MTDAPPPYPGYPAQDTQKPPLQGYGQQQQYGQPGAPGYNAMPPPAVHVVNPGIQTVVVQASTVRFNETPVRCKCQHCLADIVTTTSYRVGVLTWIICGVILLFGCWLFCCLIPFCINSCKDVVHSCPSCHQQVGVFQRVS